MIKRLFFSLLLLLGLGGSYSRFPDPKQLQDILALVTQKSSLDPRMTYFDVSATVEGNQVVLSGQVGDSEQKLILFAGFKQLATTVVDRVEVFPFKQIANPYGIIHPQSANVFESPAADEKLLTQFLMGTLVRVFKAEADWLFVQNVADQYIGWIPKRDVLLMTEKTCGKLVQWDTLIVTQKESAIYDTSELSVGKIPVLLATRLPVIALEQRAYKVFYPEGERMQIGYIPQEDSRIYSPSLLNIQDFLNTALVLKDTPYLSGGNTVLKWDSSGFIQTLFSLYGYQLPREYQQQRKTVSPVYNLLSLKPGDLVFFPEEVGIYLGGGKLLLASPRYQRTVISSLNKGDREYDVWLKEHFLSGGRLKCGMGNAECGI